MKQNTKIEVKLRRKKKEQAYIYKITISSAKIQFTQTYSQPSIHVHYHIKFQPKHSLSQLTFTHSIKKVNSNGDRASIYCTLIGCMKEGILNNQDAEAKKILSYSIHTAKVKINYQFCRDIKEL